MKTFVSILLTFLLLACTKIEIEKVENNQPPYEQIVTAQMREGYVNRLYITLVGRKATETEFETGLALLGEKALEVDRAKLVNDILSLPEYNKELYAVVRGDYLESVDTALIKRDYQQAVNALKTATGGSREYWLYVEKTLKKLVEIPALLNQNQIDIIEIHRRAVYNPYYDDINMGTENFVVATFQNFLFRYPTKVELENGKLMVDGYPASVFLKGGSSKDDFIQIFFDTDDYFEGQVINLYRKYLFANPATAEMVTLTKEFETSKDYKQLQINILSSDGYFFN